MSDDITSHRLGECRIASIHMGDFLKRPSQPWHGSLTSENDHGNACRRSPGQAHRFRQKSHEGGGAIAGLRVAIDE